MTSAGRPFSTSRRTFLRTLAAAPALSFLTSPTSSISTTQADADRGSRVTSVPTLPAAGEGFLLGMYCSRTADVLNLEATVGRQFNGIARYRDANAWTPWPLPEELPFINRRNLLRYPLESRVFNFANYEPPQGVPGPTWQHVNPANGATYAGYRHVDFSSGALDILLGRVADGLKASLGTFLIDYDHEMDDNRHLLAQHPQDWGPITYNRSAAYTNPANPNPKEYIDAHRYIVQYLRNAGVRNAVYGFCPAGWTLGRNSDRLGQLYPGDAWVDVLMWDPYNGQGAWRSFAQIVQPMYSAIDAGLFGTIASNKARLLGEFGCRTHDARRRDWFEDMISEAQDFPKLRGGLWFSSGSWGAVHGNNLTAHERPAFVSMVNSAYLNNWKTGPRP